MRNCEKKTKIYFNKKSFKSINIKTNKINNQNI